MSLTVDVAAVKDYLEVDHTDDDTLLDRLLSTATAKFEQYIERKLFARDDPFIEVLDGGKEYLKIRNFPIDPNPATPLTVFDNYEDAEVDSDLVVIYSETGRIGLTSNGRMPVDWHKGRRRYTVTYKGGLEFDEYWEDYTRTDIEQSIIDLVAWLYEDRNPSATSERSGSGFGTSFDSVKIPHRIKMVWDQYARIQF